MYMHNCYLMISERAMANPSILSESRLVVGSSSASRPQFIQKLSESASLIIMEARTFWPALHRPRMSKMVSPFTMTTFRKKQKKMKFKMFHFDTHTLKLVVLKYACMQNLSWSLYMHLWPKIAIKKIVNLQSMKQPVLTLPPTVNAHSHTR